MSPENLEQFESAVRFIRRAFKRPEGPVPLHEPCFSGKELEYLREAVESTFVSSVGPFVDRFEARMAEITGCRHAVATTTGTSALHTALLVAGVGKGDEVVTQPLTFVGTANAIAHAQACPLFVDVDRKTLGLSPQALGDFLGKNTEMRADGCCYNLVTGNRISACVPMHTYGFPCEIDPIVRLCAAHGIQVIEDAAESIGSRVGERHTGSFGLCGIFSFNGNKTVTCGGGGALVTNDADLAKKAKHLTTTAKVPHRWLSVHNQVAYNYRLPNINAALACAQLEQLEFFLERKRELAQEYRRYFEGTSMEFLWEPEGTRANFWLMTVLLKDADHRDAFLEYTNDRGVMTRSAWELMHRLPMFSDAPRGPLENAQWLADRIVNIPSSVRP